MTKEFILLIIAVIIFTFIISFLTLHFFSNIFKLKNNSLKINLKVASLELIIGIALTFLVNIFLNILSSFLAPSVVNSSPVDQLLDIIFLLISIFLSWLIFKFLMQRNYEVKKIKLAKIFASKYVFANIIIILVVLALRSYLVSPLEMTGNAMYPTMANEDLFLISTIDDNYQRGDIVVFYNGRIIPIDSKSCKKIINKRDLEIIDDECFLKDLQVGRIIGLPGEKLTIKEGEVFINSQKLTEDYLGQNTPTCLSQNCIANQESEGETYEAPGDSYFLLGDNRQRSNDSRFWDYPFVGKDDIVGKYWLTLISD
jgi:signal peptidase I